MLGVLRFPSGEYKRVLSVVGEHATVAPEHVPAASGQRHHAGRRARLDKGLLLLGPERVRTGVGVPAGDLQIPPGRLVRTLCQLH